MLENKAFIIIDKPSQLDEIVSAINYLRINNVTFCIKNPDRIDKLAIKEAINHLNIEFSFYKEDFNSHTLAMFVEDLKKQQSKHIMLSINYMSVFYRSIPSLKKNGMNIIHLTDGLTNAFPLHGVLLAQNVKSIFTFFKACLIYLFYKKALSDYCFYSLYPIQSCFSKKTYPLNVKHETVLPDNIKNKLENSGITTLVVPGWGMNMDEITEYFGLNDFCATTKHKEFIVNSDVIVLESFVTAETLLRNYPIKKIYGTPSTVMYFAKQMNKDIECSVVLDGHLNKVFGLFFEFYYEKIGKKLNILFYKSTESYDKKTNKKVS